MLLSRRAMHACMPCTYHAIMLFQIVLLFCCLQYVRIIGQTLCQLQILTRISRQSLASNRPNALLLIVSMNDFSEKLFLYALTFYNIFMSYLRTSGFSPTRGAEMPAQKRSNYSQLSPGVSTVNICAAALGCRYTFQPIYTI